MDDYEKQMAHLLRFGVPDKDQQLEELRRSQERPKKPKEEKKLYETPVDWELDLHGQNIQEASASVAEMFDLAARVGMKRLRIIHGGRLGHYGPMAKHIQRLLQSQFRKEVKRIELDGLNDGAILIYL